MHENVQIYIKDQMPPGIDISSILDKINLSIPPHLTSEIDSIYIGMFAEFEEMETDYFTEPDEEDSTELGEVPAEERKGSILQHNLFAPYLYGRYTYE